MSRRFEHAPVDLPGLPPVLKALLGANLFFYVLGWLVSGEFTRLFGLVPAQVIGQRWVWQLFTYMFLHGSLMHLLFNLLALWMFGSPVESQWGAREFLKYYLLCGVGAGLVSVAVSPHSTVPVIGASGAVYGLLVAFAMLYPDAVVYLYGFFPIKARHMAVLFGVVEFAAGVSHSTPGVARLAHLSGMAVGYLYLRWWWILQLRAKALLGGLLPAASPRPARARAVRAADQPAHQRGARAPESVGAAPVPALSHEEEMAVVDRILDKILEKGESSLTSEELEILRRHRAQ
ncbi:MAG: rhomboid family intramembrane serine protease [Elusimicrobiota bacterium]